MSSYRERVERGDFDEYRIDLMPEPPDAYQRERQAMMAQQLAEINPVNMSRMARKAYYDKDWMEVSGAGAGYGAFDLHRLQQLCFFLYKNNWLASNIIDNFTYLTAAGGFKVEWDSDADETAWKEIAERTRFHYRQMEIMQATFCYGQFFTTRWPITPFGQAEPPKVKPDVRGIDPWHITKIKRVDGDPEEIEWYEQGPENKFHPEDIIYHRVRYIGNYGDGLPILISILDPLYWAEKFLANQHWLHHIRCRIPMIYKVQGSATDVSAAKGRFGTSLPKPGVIRFANMGEDAIFPSLNLGAADSSKLYRMFILACSEGVGLPEFLVGGSAENSAYASLLAQESPTVRKIKHFQFLFKDDFRRIITGLTGKRTFRINVPEVVERDFAELAKAWVMMYQAGIYSQKTCVEKTGGTWDGEDGEAARIAAEMQGEGAFVPEESFDPALADSINDVFRKKPAWRKNMAEEIEKITPNNGRLREVFLELTA